MAKFKNMAKYRIVQVGDTAFVVEENWENVISTGSLWWKRYTTVDRWIPIGGAPYMRGFPSPPPRPPFGSEAAAQKWINDKRKYPIVVKDPA
jgi:hypothetical protein